MVFVLAWRQKMAVRFLRVVAKKVASVSSLLSAVSKIRPLRLTKSADFETLKQKGFRISSRPWLLANFLHNKGAGLRVGWTVPVYVGSAVIRNRLKRWIREDLKKLSSEILDISIDVNLVLKRQNGEFYRELNHKDFTDALVDIFQKLAQRRK
jgi:ribonuclease P protein component